MGKFTLNRGTTFSLNITYKKNGVAASLVGCTVRFTIKDAEYDTNTSDTTAAVKKNITSHVDAVNGLTNVTLVPADTSTVTPGLYYYDLKVMEGDGSVYKIDEGTVTIDGSPTNRLA